MSLYRWACGVTTVPARKDDLLPATLASLREAGFDAPRLFVDGAAAGWEGFGLEVTYRSPTIRAWANWLLGLEELLIRNPAANRFLMCQDDVLFCRNVRAYLDRCRFPDGGIDKRPYLRGWWNLYTAPKEEQRLAAAGERRWAASSQGHKGALALVFDREGVLELLGARQTLLRPLDPSLGWRNIDGGVGKGLVEAGRQELCHMPSLAQHCGMRTTIQRNYDLDERSQTWEAGFDALSLLG